MNASTVSCAPPSHSVLSSIRRLVEPYTPEFDVWSLVQLLEDMRRAAEAFGRSEIEGLFDASDAPSYEGELRDFLVESMWKNVGDVDGGADRLRARQIKEDIKGLRDATEDVKRYADLVVALNAREKPAPVAFSVISSATDEIVRIAKRYTAALAGRACCRSRWLTSSIGTTCSTSRGSRRLRRSGCSVRLAGARRYASSSRSASESCWRCFRVTYRDSASATTR
jgi:hypothetical protein